MRRTLLPAALLSALYLGAQPQFPQHSTGWPSVLPPPINNHITNLSRTIGGRPLLARPGARPIYPVGVYGGYYGGYYGDGWASQPQTPPVVLINQQNAAPPAPILIVNPDYKPEVAKPAMSEYSNIRNPYENFKPNAPKVFLLALKDGSLRQSVAFWAEKDRLHFVRPDHKQESVALSELDRESTKRFNDERGIEIKLPE